MTQAQSWFSKAARWISIGLLIVTFALVGLAGLSPKLVLSWDPAFQTDVQGLLESQKISAIVWVLFVSMPSLAIGGLCLSFLAVRASGVPEQRLLHSLSINGAVAGLFAFWHLLLWGFTRNTLPCLLDLIALSFGLIVLHKRRLQSHGSRLDL